MEALSGSQSLEGLIQSRKVAKWAGCSAKTFADAVVARLETLCETESYKADVLGRKAEVKAFYDRAVAANIHCLGTLSIAEHPLNAAQAAVRRSTTTIST